MPSTNTVQLIIDGTLQTCDVTTQPNGDYLCESQSTPRFVKFPEGDLESQVLDWNTRHQVVVEDDE